jgi:hypothetical protein
MFTWAEWPPGLDNGIMEDVFIQNALPTGDKSNSTTNHSNHTNNPEPRKEFVYLAYFVVEYFGLFLIPVKNTYLTIRPSTPVSTHVYKGFVLEKNLSP